MSRDGEPLIVRHLICFGLGFPERFSAFGVEGAIDIVEVECLAALLLSQIHSGAHDALDDFDAGGVEDIEPPLASPGAHFGAFRVRREIVLVGPPVLPRASADVANDFVAVAFERLNRRVRRVEHVDDDGDLPRLDVVYVLAESAVVVVTRTPADGVEGFAGGEESSVTCDGCRCGCCC